MRLKKEKQRGKYIMRKKINNFILIVLISFFVSSIYLFSNMNSCVTKLDIVIYFGGYFCMLSFPIVIGLIIDKREGTKDEHGK